jgi:hypothetical protein
MDVAMTIRVRSHVTTLAIFCLFSSLPTKAVCPQPHPRICAEYFHSDVVFTGTVTSVRNAPKGVTDPEGWFYRLKVTKSYRGPAQGFIEVFTGNDSGGFPLEKGHSYLLFGYKAERVLTIDNCGDSAELSEAGKTIAEIERAMAATKSASGGDIGGRVLVYGDTAGVNGIKVVATGHGRKYAGVTDENGSFHIHVPPGRYVVWPETSKWIVTPYDLSYDNEDHVVVQRGGCAELQFLASPK